MKYCSPAFAKWHDCAAGGAMRGVDIIGRDDELRAPLADALTTGPFTTPARNVT
jgi:hypothetical protein